MREVFEIVVYESCMRRLFLYINPWSLLPGVTWHKTKMYSTSTLTTRMQALLETNCTVAKEVIKTSRVWPHNQTMFNSVSHWLSFTKISCSGACCCIGANFLYIICDENILNHALYNHTGIHPVHSCLPLLSIRALKFASPTSNDLALHVFLTVESTCARPAYRSSTVHNRLTQTFLSSAPDIAHPPNSTKKFQSLFYNTSPPPTG